MTIDPSPLVLAIAAHGRLEEEVFLTTFLFEEAKHTACFSRWVREVAGSPPLPPAPEPAVKLFDHRALAVNGLMPGLCAGLVQIKRDESRHIAYGVYLLSRLVAEDGSVWDVIEQRMAELQPLLDAFIRSGYEACPDGVGPFGLGEDEAAAFAAAQFRKRYERIARARTSTLAEIEASREPGDLEDLVAEL